MTSSLEPTPVVVSLHNIGAVQEPVFMYQQLVLKLKGRKQLKSQSRKHVSSGAYGSVQLQGTRKLGKLITRDLNFFFGSKRHN
ncbi:hypothetical protein NQ314_018177 [Rhamnusium bicolor]|uniref:Uncharacterized protein n=1 Tax=Rhamnusium bicolor TaxID=1586634 RepID=A0AAV8WRL0_9CUCU|nr:hypothetical protein NQ314_018177 [Rhamnusium bicolor]